MENIPVNFTEHDIDSNFGDEPEMDDKETKIKELFDMIYGWGRANIVTDFESNAFRKTLKEVVNLYE